MRIESNAASVTPQAWALRALMLLGISTQLAHAQVDCSAGFECGRVAWGEYVRDGAQSYRLWLQEFDGARRTLLADFGPSSGNFVRGLRFDATSRHLYFIASATSNFDTNVFRIRVDGTGLDNLTEDGCFTDEFALSPDGARIAYQRNCGPTDLDDKIWLMDNDGGNQRLLTTAPPVSNDPTANQQEKPAFSPDGQFVVFTSLAGTSGSRQVYRSTLDGNTVVPLTDPDIDSRFNDEPVYLPDGRIVYASGRAATQGPRFNDLYRMDGNGGGGLRLTNIVGGKSGLVVSPDGSRVLFINRPDPVGLTVPPALYLARTDGSGVVALYEDPAADRVFVNNARFSPDGSRVAFQLCFSSGGDCTNATRVVDLDGGNAVTYGSATDNVPFGAFGRPDVDGDGVIDGADSCPAVPNGYRIAVELAPLDVWTMNYDGSQQVRLTTSSAADVQPRFDATGRHIIFSSSRAANDFEIYRMNADGSGVVRLTSVAGADEEPAFSPDGIRIAFLGTRPSMNGFRRNVWVMDADGSNPLRLTTSQGFNGQANNPVFNRDGTRIAFDTVRDILTGNNRDIYSIRTDGTDEVRLTTTAGIDMEATYSPDGSRIVFISYRDGAATNGEIYTMRADGTDPQRITRTTFRESRPIFSPDGAQIVFMADYDGSLQLHAMNRDGTGLRQITRGTNYDRPTLAPQADADADGIGDACDPAFDAATAVGAPVTVRAPDVSVEFAGVSGEGSTSFTRIQPDPGAMPAGYSLCSTCPAFEITTTARIEPPLTVCIAVPAGVPAATFLQLRLLHGENGQWVDRTTLRIDQPGVPRQVCGVVDSLSPFALAEFDGAQPAALFANGFE
ncbi:MAG: PD40 domain-containing protein [Xanthomonadales bacterium]|nr:PD40 domain-containing protein [Xanthomonadales bacterium]